MECGTRTAIVGDRTLLRTDVHQVLHTLSSLLLLGRPAVGKGHRVDTVWDSQLFLHLRSWAHSALTRPSLVSFLFVTTPWS